MPIAGLGKAAELAAAELDERRRSLDALRRRFESGLAAIPECVVHAAGSPRLPHTTHVAFLGTSGHELMLRLDAAGYAVSTGAACHAGRPQASAALLKMGMPEDEALASLRVSFGIFNTAAEVDGFLETLAQEVAALRVRESTQRGTDCFEGIEEGRKGHVRVDALRTELDIYPWQRFSKPRIDVRKRRDTRRKGIIRIERGHVRRASQAEKPADASPVSWTEAVAPTR